MNTAEEADSLIPDPVQKPSKDEHEDFFSSYLEAAWFTDIDNPDSEEFVGKDLGTQDINAESLAKISEQCASFLDANYADLLKLENPMEQGGHDFWFTRNRHGAGFWDRRELEGGAGERLTAAAHAFGETTPVLGDNGEIYFE